MSEQPPQDQSPQNPPPHDPNVPPQNPYQAPQNPYQPPQNPYQPQQAYPPYGGPGAPGAPVWGVPDHPKAATVLILGILGMAVCQLVAPFAWIMGGRVKREIDANPNLYGGRSQVQVGYILGIVGSAILGLVALFFVLYLVVVIIAIAASA